MKTSKLAKVVAASLICAGAASASLITINVTDGGSGVGTNPSNIGGVVASPYIENMAGSGGSFVGKNTTSIANFKDSTGASSGVSVSSSSGWNNGGYAWPVISGYEGGSDNSSDEMMNNFTDTSSGSVTFAGLSTWLSGQGATAYNVYVMSDREANRYEGSFTIGATKYWLSNGTSQAGPYALGTATTLAAAQAAKDTANYLKFSGVTGDSFTLTVARDTGGSGWINVNALQIEAIPEPGTFGMMGLIGSVALLVRRRMNI